MSDYKGAALMIDAFPKAKALLADRGYDADWFHAALEQRGITLHPAKNQSQSTISLRHGDLQEASLGRELVAKVKGWRRTYTRYNRFVHAFMSAISIAETLIFWCNRES